jgi:Domain of unknown function (DUF6285)
MQEKPDPKNLLETARALLLEKLLPLLPGSARLEARMVASAMAIAARGIGAPDTPPEQELAAAIRAGRLDDDPALLARLREMARARLAVSNPRAL